MELNRSPRSPNAETFRAESREAAVAHHVVLALLLLVAEHVVGLLDLLELLFGGLVIGVSVGMVLLCQLAIGLLHLIGRRAF